MPRRTPPPACLTCLQMVFTAGSAIVAMAAAAGGRQRFFLGHTAHVVALAFDGEGMLMASAQEGKVAVVRLWDFRAGLCVAVLNGAWLCAQSCEAVLTHASWWSATHGRALPLTGRAVPIYIYT